MNQHQNRQSIKNSAKSVYFGVLGFFV